MIGLTAPQWKMLRFIRGYQLANGGVSPTLERCAAGVGLKAKSGAHRTLQRLSERGAVRISSGRRLIIEIIETPAIPSIQGAPLFAVPVIDGRFTRFSGERL